MHITHTHTHTYMYVHITYIHQDIVDMQMMEVYSTVLSSRYGTMSILRFGVSLSEVLQVHILSTPGRFISSQPCDTSLYIRQTEWH